jgi:hypothetical protein
MPKNYIFHLPWGIFKSRFLRELQCFRIKDYNYIYATIYFSLIQWTLEITEVAIKNGQSRETGNIGYIGTQDVEKQNPTQGKHAHVM